MVTLRHKARALEHRGIRDPGLVRMESFYPLWFLASLKMEFKFKLQERPQLSTPHTLPEVSRT